MLSASQVSAIEEVHLTLRDLLLFFFSRSCWIMLSCCQGIWRRIGFAKFSLPQHGSLANSLSKPLSS